jgi:hypothetical protein
MIGESNQTDLKDIDLQEIKKYNYNTWENKKLCFLREKIQEMNYGCGAHNCNPKGSICYSSKIYMNKHMKMMGIPFLIENYTSRFIRAEEMRTKYGMATHYTADISYIEKIFMDAKTNCTYLE